MRPVNSNFSMIEGAAGCPLTSSPAALFPPDTVFLLLRPSGTQYARSPSQICCHGDLGQHFWGRACLSQPSEWQVLSKTAPPRSTVPSKVCLPHGSSSLPVPPGHHVVNVTQGNKLWILKNTRVCPDFPANLQANHRRSPAGWLRCHSIKSYNEIIKQERLCS